MKRVYSSSVLLLSILLLLQSPVSAADLDKDAAWRDYQTALRETERVKSIRDAKYRELERAKNDLKSAQARERQAKNTVQREEAVLQRMQKEMVQLRAKLKDLEDQTIRDVAELKRLQNNILSLEEDVKDEEDKVDILDKKIRQAKRKINQLENQPRKGPWTCNYHDKGWEEHSGGHPATHKNKQKAMEKAQKACEDAHGSCKLVGCSQPPPKGLKQAKARLKRLENERNQIQNKIRLTKNEITKISRKLPTIKRRIEDCKRQIRDTQTLITSLEFKIPNQERAIQNAYQDYQRAQTNTDLARQEVSRVRAVYAAANADYKAAKRNSDSALAYYNKVKSNYDNAYAAALSQAKSQGQAHGVQEANSRVGNDGQSAGHNKAVEVGTTAGNQEGQERAEVEGYQYGRKSGSSDGTLSASYAQGRTTGSQLAEKKALAENFPKGFNAALENHFSAAPPNAMTVDISQSIGSDPGGNGVPISLETKKVGNEPAPGYSMPQVPSPSVPGRPSTSVTVPGVQQTHYSAPCSGLAHPDFASPCESAYENSYEDGFESRYRAAYLSNFKSAFDAHIETAYLAAYNAAHKPNFDKGAHQGAVHQGVLLGFADQLAISKQEQYKNGGAAFQSKLSQGYALFVSAASLEESNGDGILSPSEEIQLTLVVDNYGLVASSLGKVRIKLTGLDGLEDPSFELRKLPAIAAHTRVTLTGVLSVLSNTQYPGESMKLGAHLQVEKDGQFVSIARIDAQGKTQFPLELSKIQAPARIPLNQESTTQFIYTNNTNQTIGETEVLLSNSPKFVEILDPKVLVPELGPGESTSIDVRVEPMFWVGENTDVTFISEADLSAFRTKQRFGKLIKVDRAGSLLLFDRFGRPLPSGRIKVKAGGIATFQVQFKYHAKVRLPGPFVLERGKASDPSIKPHGSNTVRINYGSWSPKSQPPAKITFNFRVPAKLKDQTASITTFLKEGGRIIHGQPIYLDIF